MKYLITKWFGTFLYDDNRIIKQILFPNKEEIIIEKLKKINNGEILSEEKEITKNIEVIVNEKRLSKMGQYQPKDNFFKKNNIKPEEFCIDNKLLHQASIKIAESIVYKDLKSADLQIIQMINTYDDFIKINNLISERLEVWSKLPLEKEKIQPLKNINQSIKIELKEMEKQLVKETNELAPNVTNLIGSILCARLISKAGSLKRLATFPASTIQILGAEKALFRFKKEGGKPPKHGIIYQHPLINKAQRKLRGKIARLISGKIAIGAKADLFSKRDISEELIKDIKQKLKKIKK